VETNAEGGADVFICRLSFHFVGVIATFSPITPRLSHVEADPKVTPERILSQAGVFSIERSHRIPQFRMPSEQIELESDGHRMKMTWHPVVTLQIDQS